MVKYESPKIEFEKLTFFEKIALDECWSAKEVYYDMNGNKKFDCGEDLILYCESSCDAGDTSSIAVQIALKIIGLRRSNGVEACPPSIDAKSSSIPGIKILRS